MTARPTAPAELLARQPDLTVLNHSKNRGYGAALITMFSYALNIG